MHGCELMRVPMVDLASQMVSQHACLSQDALWPETALNPDCAQTFPIAKAHFSMLHTALPSDNRVPVSLLQNVP
jgi:hypothetical protein